MSSAPSVSGGGMSISQVELLWIPLGSGGPRLVCWSGRIYERCCALLEHRDVCDLYHSALRVRDEEGTTVTIEVAPAWGTLERDRGVVRTGPVGTRLLGRFTLFRYEVRCWRDGVVPDAAAAVPGPLTLATDRRRTGLLLDQVSLVPAPTWGRRAPGTTEMWNSNSVVSWLLLSSGHSLPDLPVRGRAPGWRSGVELALRPAEGPACVGPTALTQSTGRP